MAGEPDVTSSPAAILRGDRLSQTPRDPHQAAATPEVTRWSSCRVAILIALYLLPAAVIMRPVLDNDIWMNLHAGRWIVAHRAVPQTDPFSVFGQGRPWVAYSWLFEVLVFGLEQGFGLAGVVAYRVVMSYAILASIHRLVARREPRFVVATGLCGMAFFALVPMLNERTWLFTILFSTVTLDMTLHLRQGGVGRTVWLLPLVYALWANVHIQFIYGLFLLALGCLAPVIDGLLGLDRAGGRARVAGTPDWWRLLALAAACACATLLNPYGPRLYDVVFDYARKSETYNLVIELLAPSFRMPWEWAMPALVGSAVFALGRGKQRSSFELLLLVTATVLALRARRDVWFAVLAALAALVSVRQADDEPRRVAPCLHRPIGITALGIALLAATGTCLVGSQGRLEGAVASSYPARAAAVVQQRRCSAPLFNEYGWGSYLIWRLPELPVSIDGRADLHGPERIRQNVNTLSGVRGWDSDPDLQSANTILIGAGTALASLLRLDGRFQLIYEDAVAVAFLRKARARGSDEPPADRRPRASTAAHERLPL
jgi:hypothetical protein